MQFREIQIDLDVNRWIESKRVSFSQTHNDILRAEAGLPSLSPRAVSPASAPLNGRVTSAGAWSGKGATLPAGTPVRMSYNGKVYNGVIDSGDWLVNGGRYGSPSQAASAITGVSLNGWLYWEAQIPGTNKWQPISKLRTEVTRRRPKANASAKSAEELGL